MSATASPASLPRSSSTRRQHAFAPTADRTHYSPTTSSRSAAPNSPRRSLSQGQDISSSHRHTSSSGQAQLANVARRDFEQTNVARVPSASRRSESQDRTTSGGTPHRSDSARNPPAAARHTHARQHSDAPIPAPSSMVNGGNPETMSRHTTNTSTSTRRRTTIEATTGIWELGKTIGAGSMGKVKLAKNRETNEQVRPRWIYCE